MQIESSSRTSMPHCRKNNEKPNHPTIEKIHLLLTTLKNGSKRPTSLSESPSQNSLSPLSGESKKKISTLNIYEIKVSS